MVKKILGFGILLAMAISIFAFAGCVSKNDDETYVGDAVDRVQMLAALESVRETNSYTETIRLVAFTNSEQNIDQKNIIKYESNDGKIIAEGYSTIEDAITQRIYFADGYMYTWSMKWQAGIKIFLGTEIMALKLESTSADFSAEAIEQLGAFDLAVTKTKINTIYSFKVLLEGSEYDDNKFSYEYKITVESANNRLLEIKMDSNSLFNGQTIINNYTVSYDYTPITVTLPDDLDTYMSL